MYRRRFIASVVGTSLASLLPSPAIGATTNRKGFMLATQDIGAIRADISRIADLGGNIVRFPLYFNFEPSLAIWIDRLEAAYEVCSQRGVTLVIDNHHPTSSRPLGDSTIDDVDDFVNKWSIIAQRFSSRRRIWYDLCNEPKKRTSQGVPWKDVALLAAQAIRRYDSRHKIVYAAPGTTTRSASRFNPLPGINRQVLEFHFYNWPRLQFNTQPGYPSRNYTKENLTRLLQEVSDAGKRHNLPVYIGEVAINQAHPNAPRFLRDFTSLCDQFDINLTIHAYREAPIWNYENNPRAWRTLTTWLQRA